MLKTKIHQYVYWHEKDHFQLETDIEAYWILYILEKGSCSFHIEEDSGIAKAGDLLICPPYTSFYRKAITTLNFHFLRFSLENSLLDESQLIGLISISNKKRLDDSCMLLKKIQFDSNCEMDDLRNHLLDDLLFMYLYDHSLIVQTEQTNIKDSLIKKSLAYLSDLSDTSLSIEDISKKLTINPCHFSRKFKKEMGGITPIEYRNRIRLQKAQQQLIETNDSMEQVAEDCGYSNSFYFSRNFSKHMGESPSSYRNNHKV